MSKIPTAITRAAIHARLLEKHPEIHGPKIAGRAGSAAAFLEEAGSNLEAALKALTDQLPGPAAAKYDRTGAGHTTVLDDIGVPMPAVPDPTGEAAIRGTSHLNAAWQAFTEHVSRCEDLALALRFGTKSDPTDSGVTPRRGVPRRDDLDGTNAHFERAREVAIAITEMGLRMGAVILAATDRIHAVALNELTPAELDLVADAVAELRAGRVRLRETVNSTSLEPT